MTTAAGPQALARYELDIPGFAKDVLGLTKGIHPGQIRVVNAAMQRRSRWVARWLTIAIASGNRAGKTSTLAIIIIHSCIFKTNLMSTWAPMDAEKAAKKWARAEYHWYHFGIRDEVVALVFEEMQRILTGNHVAQQDGCPLTANGPVATFDGLELREYPWVRFSNGAQVHFRTTSQKALGSLGRDMHGLSMDEAGLEPKLRFLMEDVFDFRRLGTGGQLFIASTPSEDLGTEFPDIWEAGNPENPNQQPNALSLRMSTRDNIGFGLTQEMFDILTEGMDQRRIDQNVEGIFLQARAAYFNGENVEGCFFEGLPERQPAVKGMLYLQGADPAKEEDSMWSIVLAAVADPEDPANPYLVGVRADKADGQKSTPRMVALVADGYNAYNSQTLGTRCYTAIDATGFGGKMFREALDAAVPQVFNVEFGGTAQRKKKLLGDLRQVIDTGRLLLPNTGNWKIVRKQLLGYKLADRGLDTDAVMALVCAIWLVKRAPVGGQTSSDFDLSGYDTDDEEMTEADRIARERMAARG